MRFWSLKSVEVKVEVETRLAKGEAEMKSSRFNGVNRGLSGFGYLTFASALVVMFASPAFGNVKLESNYWAFTEKEGEAKILSHADSDTRKEFLEKMESVNTDNLDAAKEAIELFKSEDDKTPMNTQAFIESLSDAFMKATSAENEPEKKIEALEKAVNDALASDEEAMGIAFDEKGKEISNRTAGVKAFMKELRTWLKSKEFKVTEEELTDFIKKALAKKKKGKTIMSMLGMTDKQPKKKEAKDKDKEKEKKDKEKAAADAKAEELAKKEEAAKKEEEEKNKNKGPAGNDARNNQIAGGAQQPGGTEQAFNPCPVQAQDPLADFVRNLQDQFARLRQQANPGDDLLNLADALNKNRNNDNAAPVTPPSQPFPQPNNNNSRQDEQPPESLAKDTPPPQQPNPAFADTGAPIIANAELKKPSYKKVAEDGARETQELSNQVSASKQLTKKADNFISGGLQQLQQSMFLPNGQLNPWGFASAMGQVSSWTSKLRSEANNALKLAEWGKTRVAALTKELKGLTAENARGEDADNAIKNLTKVESELQARISRKNSECSSAQLPQEQQACKSAVNDLTTSLTQVKQQKESQQAAIAKGDKQFDEGYVADLKEQLTSLQAEVKKAEAEASTLEDKASEVERMSGTLQGQVAAMNAQPQGSTTGQKLQAGRNGGGRTVTASGGFQGSAAGTGRGNYSPQSR